MKLRVVGNACDIGSEIAGLGMSVFSDVHVLPLVHSNIVGLQLSAQGVC